MVWVAEKDPIEFGAGGFYAKVEKKRVLDILHDPAHKWIIKPLVKAYDGDCVEFVTLHPKDVPHPSSPDLNRYIVKTTTSIKAALDCGKLVGVVVLDHKERYVASYDSNFFTEALSLWTISKNPAEGKDGGSMTANEFEQLANKIISHTIFGALLTAPDKRIQTGEGYEAYITETNTLKSAWNKLQNTRGEFLVVTDHERVFKGVLKRTTIQDLLLGQLAGGPAQRS